MKVFNKLFLTLVSSVLFSGMAMANMAYPIAECTNHEVLGAPRYEVRIVPSMDSSVPVGYELAIIPLNPMVEETRVEFGRDDFIHYGDTMIVRIDHGRSGYAMLYFNGDTSLIDINLFMPEAMYINTDGPVTAYQCSMVYRR